MVSKWLSPRTPIGKVPHWIQYQLGKSKNNFVSKIVHGHLWESFHEVNSQHGMGMSCGKKSIGWTFTFKMQRWWSALVILETLLNSAVFKRFTLTLLALFDSSCQFNKGQLLLLKNQENWRLDTSCCCWSCCKNATILYNIKVSWFSVHLPLLFYNWIL